MTSHLVPILTMTLALVPSAPASAQSASEPFEYLYEGFLPDPYVRQVVAGGTLDVDEGACGYGYISEDPNLVFLYSGNGASDLFIYAESEADVTLFVDDLEDVRCDDDSYSGTDPLVALHDTHGGILAVYVGTYSGGTAPARLFVSERDPRSGSEVAKQGTYGDLGWVELDEGFLPDPYDARVDAGGPLEDDRCGYGYVSEEPVFFVDYYRADGGSENLFLYADSSSDVTLRVESESGEVFCDDDGLTGTNPLVVLTPDSGDGHYLDVYVGTYSRGTAAATLHVSEIDPRSRASTTTDLRRIELEEGFLPDPHTANVQAGGSVGGDQLGCHAFGGYFPETSSADLSYDAGLGGLTDLYIYAHSDTDVTLRVESPDGDMWCDDDGYSGTDPLVVIPAAGIGAYNTYDIRVGTYAPGAATAVLYVSELDPRDVWSGEESIPDARLRASEGDVRLEEGFLPDPYRLENLAAGGPISVSTGGCTYGYVPDAPQVDIRYTSRDGGDLYLFTGGPGDMTLLVRSASGQWYCDDDGHADNNPLVVVPNASGDYSVWIGTYVLEEAGARTTLHISEKDPR